MELICTNRPVCSQNLELVILVPESRLPSSTCEPRLQFSETGIKYLNERGEGISFFFALFGLRNIKQRNPVPISPVSHPFRTLTSHPTFLPRLPYSTLRLFSPASAPLTSHTQLGHVALLELNQRRFWATFLNRKWAIFYFNMLWRYQICMAMCLYSYRDDLTKRLFKITAQVRKKSTSGWSASLKNVAA